MARRERRILEPVEEEVGREPRPFRRAERDAAERGRAHACELGVVHPDDGHVLGHAQLQIRERAHRPDRNDVVRAEQRVGARAREEPARGANSGRVRELAAVCLQTLVVLEAGDRERGSVSLSTRRARDGARIAVHEGDRPPAGGEEMLDREPDAAARVSAHRVERLVLGERADDHDRHLRGPECSQVVGGDAERAQDEAVGVPATEALDEVDLVRRIGSGGVQDESETGSLRQLVDRAHHLDVDRVRDVGDREGELHRSPGLE